MIQIQVSQLVSLLGLVVLTELNSKQAALLNELLPSLFTANSVEDVDRFNVFIAERLTDAILYVYDGEDLSTPSHKLVVQLEAY